MINKEEVKRLFKYKDGELIHLTSHSKYKIGDKAGSSRKGYLMVGINYKRYFIHRLIFLYHHGYLPKEIDHIDCNPLNNKIENLRPVTHSQNCQNTKIRVNNKSGVKCVDWVKKDKAWRVRLRVNGVRLSFGYYKDLELAELVADEARSKYHGEFARC